MPPTTYKDAMSELQQRGIDAVKVAQTAQLSTLRAARDIAAPTAAILPVAAGVAGAAFAFGCRLIAIQAAYAQQLVNGLTAARADTVLDASAVALALVDASAKPLEASSEVVRPVLNSPIIAIPPFAEPVTHELITEPAHRPVTELLAQTNAHNVPTIPSVSSNSVPAKRGPSGKPKSLL